VKYVAIIAALMPKQIEPEKALDALSDEELLLAIDHLKSRISLEPAFE
jgi:hypothetical protein